MEELHKTAQIYYESSSDNLKKLARDFFNSLDADGDGKVRRHEFLDFMKNEGHTKLGNGRFFEKLCRDGTRLGFMEVMTLYYIIKSGRPYCEGCDTFIPGMFFTCTKCYENSPNSFCICQDCFKKRRFNHRHNDDRNHFLDNYALLESKRMEANAMRKKAYASKHPPRSSLTITKIPTSTSAAASTSKAIVPYDNRNNFTLKWKHAFKVMEVALVTAADLCNIM